MKPLRIGLIGLGRVSDIHVQAIRKIPQVQLVAVCDVNVEKRMAFPDIAFYAGYERMLEMEQLDCVHICLPQHLHYTAALSAAKKGCHVLCESSPAAGMQEAMDFAVLEQEYPGLRFGLCLQWRVSEVFETLNARLGKEDTGSITGMNVTMHLARGEDYYKQKPWKAQAGGVLFHHGFYLLDLLQLLGGKMIWVRGMEGHLSALRTEAGDTACAHFLFEGGATAFLCATTVNYRNDRASLQITTEKEEFLWEGNRLWEINPDGARVLLAENADADPGRPHYMGGYTKLVQTFYECLRHGTRNYIHVSEGLATIRIADSIGRSSRMSRPASI